MVILKKFRQTGEPVIASFDWTDLASGEGFVSYYLAATNAPAVTDFILTETAIYGQQQGTTWQLTPAMNNRNFDTSTFNLPQTLKGTAIMDMVIHIADGVTNDFAVVLSVVRANGTTVSAGSIDITYSGTVDTDWQTTLRLPLTETNIKKGDKLRLAVEVDDNASGYMYMDPTNQQGEGATRIHIPFKVEA